MIGAQIGNFKIVSQLGVGGMGEVYLGEHEKIGTRVAVKMLLPDISVHKEHVERFFNEAVAVSKVQHVGIGKIFDVGFHANRAYLVMEFLPGETLATRLRRIGRMSLSQVAEVGKQICLVLEAVHQAGITHRDLKPENVFLVPDAEIGERVRIVDFGIAKLTGTGGGLTATGFGAMGTPAYMSPEQWVNSKTVDWRADAYSLGCMTFEMITGRQPFPFETIGEACAKHMGEPPPRPSMLVAVPPAIDSLILALLAKSPDQRPTSMREIAGTFAQVGNTPLTPQPMAPTIVANPHAGPQVTTMHVEPRVSAEQPAPPTRRVTPRMMEAQADPYAQMPVSQPHMVPVSQPNLVPVSSFQPRPTANRKIVAAVLGVAVIGGTAAVVISQRKKAKPPESETPTTTQATPTAKKWKTEPAVVETPPDKPAAGSGSSRPPPIPGLAVEVDSTIVSEGLADIKPEIAKSCKSDYRGVVKVSVKVRPDGSVESATLKESPHADENPSPAIARCVTNLVQGAKFKKTQFGGTFVYPFVF